MTELEFRNKVTWFSFGTQSAGDLGPFLQRGAVSGISGSHRYGLCAGTPDRRLVRADCGAGLFHDLRLPVYRDFDWGKLRGKWQRRIKSLLVPYIVWNFLYYLSYVIASRIPAVGDVVGKGVVEFSLTAMVDAVVSHTYNNVFWYLYQLSVACAAGSGALSAVKAGCGAAFCFCCFSGSLCR